MALRAKGPYDEEYELHVLIGKEEKFWLREMEKITLLNRERFLKLEQLLDDAYVVHQPEQSEHQQRKELVKVFNRIARELYSDHKEYPLVEEFGSFSMGLFTSESDLDLSINFNNSPNVYSRNEVITTLRRLKKKLYELQDVGLVCDIQSIMNAKVPVLKVADVASGIECDLSVENRDGISKSKFIYLISSLDERFRKLSILMKVWAKAHGVNSSKDQTLSSLSIVLLVAFHLQTRDPPILPPFSAILEEFIVDGEELEMVKSSFERFEKYGRRNTESLGELFISFLIKLASVKQLWPKGVCASPYHGRWIAKTWDTGIANISVEDFTDHTENVARAVGRKEVDVIYGHIEHTIRNLSSFMNGHIKESDLKESLFGNAGIERRVRQPRTPVNQEPKVQSVTISINKPKERRNQNATIVNPLLNRRMVLTSNGWEVQATQNWTTRRPPTVGHLTPKQNQAMSSNSVMPMKNDTTLETPQVLTSNGWEVQATQNWTTRRPPTVGHLRPKQNQAMSSNSVMPMKNDTTLETPQVVQPVMPVDLESTKYTPGSDGLRFGGIPEATQSWGGPGIGDWGGLGVGQGWEGPSNRCWGGFQGSYFLDPCPSSLGIQTMEVPSETRPQQPKPGTMLFSPYGPQFRRDSSSN